MDISNHPLYLYRKSHRLTRVALASKIGCATRSLARWEQGVTTPRMGLAVKTSQVTKLSIDALFGAPIGQNTRIDDPLVPV